MPRITLLFLLLTLGSLLGCAAAPYGPDRTGSVGRTDDGELIDGVQLESNDGLTVLHPETAWGTRALVDMLNTVALEMLIAYPDLTPLVVGDLSKRDGGRLSPHISHQSGRDVDLALYYLDNKPHRQFYDGRKGQLDPFKTWYLIEMLLEKGNVQYILLDWDVQQLIYEEIKIIIPEQRLNRILQYPRTKNTRTGIVRHASRHADHLHVRIHCPPQDTYCRD